ncbi:MAG: GHKL domain-containing protein [Gammaproteobacteria bacterium]|nr:MAG: GHKL domain-containing protein [Gammaproteobacteria bacterium]
MEIKTRIHPPPNWPKPCEPGISDNPERFLYSKCRCFDKRRGYPMKFKLVRFFVLTSIVFFFLTVGSLSFLQQKVAVNNLIDTAQANHVDLTKAFSNSLWDDFRPFMAETRGLSREALQNHPKQAELYQKVQHMLKGLTVLKVKVYNSDGLTIFSTQKSQIGDDKSQNGGFLSAMKGQPISELTHRDSFSAFDEVVEERDVISSYVPIYEKAGGQPVGVFEIYSDMTGLLANVTQTQYTVVGGVAGLVLLLFLSQFFAIRHADRTIEQQEREASRAKLQLAQQEKMASLGQMVAGVAHELNTPLAFSRSNIELIGEALNQLQPAMQWGHKLVEEVKQQPEKGRLKLSFRAPELRREAADYDPDLLPEEVGEVVNQTLAGLEQMAELVRNLKDFTRIDRAKVAHYEMNKGLDNVLYIAKSVIHTAIQIDKDYEDNLPRITCMPSQINQVFINLIQNAAQAVDPENGHITVRTRADGDRVRIEVEDNGSGIREDDLPHIFESFYTTKAPGEGTGLGLSIVKEIVDQHGGEIQVQSTVGEGTTFTVWLPVEAQVDNNVAQAA